jgi:hypothetical protein
MFVLYLIQKADTVVNHVVWFSVIAAQRSLNNKIFLLRFEILLFVLELAVVATFSLGTLTLKIP